MSKIFVCGINTFWDFSRLVFFVKNISEMMGRPYKMSLMKGILFGSDIDFIEQMESRNKAFHSGDSAFVIQSEDESFSSILESNGIYFPIYPIDIFHQKDFSITEEDFSFRNSAVFSPNNFEEYLKNRTPDIFEKIASNQYTFPSNRPMTEEGDLSPLYYPDGTHGIIQTLISCDLAEEQIEVLSEVLQRTISPYEKEMLIGLVSMLGEFVDSIEQSSKTESASS